MKQSEFLKTMKILETSTKSKSMDAEDQAARRDGFSMVLSRFPGDIFQEAVLSYLSDGDEFFPTPGEIKSLCVEIEQRRRQASQPQFTTKFEPEEHEHHDPEPCAALKELFFWKYEAAHVECPATVKATCPRCGTRHKAINETVEALMKRFPEQTKHWHENHKGFLLCRKCSVLNNANR